MLRSNGELKDISSGVLNIVTKRTASYLKGKSNKRVKLKLELCSSLGRHFRILCAHA
jgi:hypothetical protein